MKSKKISSVTKKISSYKNMEEKKGTIPDKSKRNKASFIQDELANDFEEVLGDGFHGMDDDYYFDEEDLY